MQQIYSNMQVRRRFMQIGVPLQIGNVLQCPHSGGCATVLALYVQTSGHKCRQVQTSADKCSAYKSEACIACQTKNLQFVCTLHFCLQLIDNHID